MTVPSNVFFWCLPCWQCFRFQFTQQSIHVRYFFRILLDIRCTVYFINAFKEEEKKEEKEQQQQRQHLENMSITEEDM